MKKPFLIIAIAILPFVVSAQYNFPLQELSNLTSKNPSDFETVMLEKDFSLQPKLSNPTTKVYTSDKPGVGGKKYTMSRRQVPGAATDLVFTTTDKKYYLEVKAKLASSGYKFVKEENKENDDETPVVWYHYSNGVYKVSICSYTTDVTWFKVEIHV